jgi:hypothetical protein
MLILYALLTKIRLEMLLTKDIRLHQYSRLQLVNHTYVTVVHVLSCCKQIIYPCRQNCRSSRCMTGPHVQGPASRRTCITWSFGQTESNEKIWRWEHLVSSFEMKLRDALPCWSEELGDGPPNIILSSRWWSTSPLIVSSFPVAIAQGMLHHSFIFIDRRGDQDWVFLPWRHFFNFPSSFVSMALFIGTGGLSSIKLGTQGISSRKSGWFIAVYACADGQLS